VVTQALLEPRALRVYLVQEGQVEIRETQGLQANLACQGYQGSLECPVSRVAGVIQGLQGWSALVQVRVREALFDKERGESAVCQGCEEGRETPALSALLDFLESPDHLPSSISLPSEVQRVTVADEVNGGVLVSPVLQVLHMFPTTLTQRSQWLNQWEEQTTL